MASQSTTPRAGDPAKSHEELPPAIRQRLAQLFQYGTDKDKQGDHDYAHSMYSQCVIKDPSNLVYVEAMLDNLKSKHEPRKKKCRVRGNRTPFKKALQGEEWRSVLQLGPELLKDNPWDIPTLRGMAQACAALHFNEVELRYLKNALDSNPKDVDVNRHCATSLARMGQLDQAIACWHRIEDVAKGEALKMISDLTMAKNRQAAGVFDEDEASKSSLNAAAKAANPSPQAQPAASSPATTPPAPPDSSGAADPADSSPQAESSPEELEKAIESHPDELDHYIRLAELHDEAGRYRDAEQVLRRALPVSGGDLQIRERLEKAQIRRSRSYLAQAEREAGRHPSEEAQEQLQRQRHQHNRLELDIYHARAERYPDDLALQYEVGVRLKRAGNFAEAVHYFEKSQPDERCTAPALLAGGECLQQMRQYTAALKAYEQAARHADPDGPHQEARRLALYRAGVLATGLKDVERARHFLSTLVEIAPDYRDAAARLDKLP